jgi:hypothetical protein
MENRECTKCNGHMNNACLYTGNGELLIGLPSKSFMVKKACHIETYVCSNCGHVELVAKDKEMFK